MVISIAIDPYLKDYLIGRYGEEPIPAVTKNLVGVLLEPMLRKPPVEYVPYTEKNSTDRILIDVKLMWKSNGVGMKNPLYYFYVDKCDNIKFKNGISGVFWETFYGYADAKLESGNTQIKDIIDMFCRKYKLNPDHANYEMMKKHYYRHRIIAKNR